MRIARISAAMRERQTREPENGKENHHPSYRYTLIIFLGNKWYSKPKEHKIPTVTERGVFSIQTKEKVFCLNFSMPQHQNFHNVQPGQSYHSLLEDAKEKDSIKECVNTYLLA